MPLGTAASNIRRKKSKAEDSAAEFAGPRCPGVEGFLRIPPLFPVLFGRKLIFGHRIGLGLFLSVSDNKQQAHLVVLQSAGITQRGGALRAFPPFRCLFCTTTFTLERCRVNFRRSPLVYFAGIFLR